MPPVGNQRSPKSPFVRAWQCHKCYQISPFLAHAGRTSIPINQCNNPPCSKLRCAECFDLNGSLEIIQFQDESAVPENIVSYLNHRNTLDLPPATLPGPPRAPNPPLQASRLPPLPPNNDPPALREPGHLSQRLAFLQSQQTQPQLSAEIPPPRPRARLLEPMRLADLRAQQSGAERAAQALDAHLRQVDLQVQLPSMRTFPPDRSSLEIAGRSIGGMPAQTGTDEEFVGWGRLQTNLVWEGIVGSDESSEEEV